MNRHLRGLSHLIGILYVGGFLGWIAGCVPGSTPSPALAPAPAPVQASGAAGIGTSIASNPTASVSGVVFKEKPDLDAFVASLKAEGLPLVTTKGVELRTFGFSAMSDILEVSGDVDESPRSPDEQWPRKFVLSPDDPATQGTINVAILPPSVTGKDGVKLILQIQTATEEKKVTKTLICDLPPLWFTSPNRRAMSQSGLDFGSKLKIKRGKGVKVIGYEARRGTERSDFQVNFRCTALKPVKKSGAAVSKAAPTTQSPP